jgi:hypothetical protein
MKNITFGLSCRKQPLKLLQNLGYAPKSARRKGLDWAELFAVSFNPWLGDKISHNFNILKTSHIRHSKTGWLNHLILENASARLTSDRSDFKSCGTSAP